MWNRILRTYAVIASALGLMLLAYGCNRPTDPGDIIITNNNTNNNNIGDNSADKGNANSKCSPEEANPTKVNVLAPVQLSVGQTFLLDATPVKSGGTGRSGECDEEQGITWRVSGPCGLSASDIFRPTLTGGPGAGVCSLLAYVTKFPGAAGSAQVQVVP